MIRPSAAIGIMAGLAGASAVAFAVLALSGPATMPGVGPQPGAAAQAAGVRAESYDPVRRATPAEEAPRLADRAAPPPDNFLELLNAPRPPPGDDPRAGRPALASAPNEIDEANRVEAEQIAAVRPQVLADVQASLRGSKTRLRAACWKGGAPTTMRIEATFDPDGKMLTYSVLGARDDGGVSACVGQQALALAVSPPGKPVTVQVPLEFP